MPRREASFVAVSLALILLTCLCPAGAQNLLRNGSFEGPTAGDVPESWSYHDFAGGRIGGIKMATGTVTAGGHVGRQCLKLQGPVFPVDFAAYCRPIDVSRLEGKQLIFSCYFRTVDHPQAEVTLATYAEDFTTREFATPELLTETHPLGETRVWSLYFTHLTVPPGAEQLVVLLRVLGGGQVFFDGVAVREVGSEVEVDLEDAGTLVELPRTRSVRARVRNVTDREIALRLEAEATEEGGRPRREAQDCRLGAGETCTLNMIYRAECATPHILQVTVRGEGLDEIHQAWRREVPGLIDARIIEPAFRATVLATIPTPHVVVEGRLNASEQLARQAQVSARLVGTGAEVAEPEPLTDRGLAGPWRLTLPAEGMLTERYQVDVTARVSRYEQTLSLPLGRAPHAQFEVAYDAAHRLWVNGEAIFPLGIYRVTDQDDLATMAEAGFNFVITPSRSVSYRYVNQAGEAGLQVAVSSPALDGLFWQISIEKFIGHPALLGWYGIQLPDTAAVTANVLREAYVNSTSGPYPAIAQMDAHHPVLLALRPNSTMAQFATAADVVLAWSEPVPRWPLTMVADAVAMGQRAVDDRKPVWAVIQSAGCGWADERTYVAPEDSRPPTPQEHRAMVYLALMAGADGLAYHAWSLPARGELPSYRMQRDAPELWESILSTNREVALLAPMLLATDPVPLEAPVGSPLRMAGWEYEGARYVIAVNPEPAGAALVLDLGARAGEEVEVLFENRLAVATNAGEIADVFEPYAAHVYKLGG
ncbi:MAG: hypothetical protein AB7Y46_05700 [Armatimonadota bacterium]